MILSVEIRLSHSFQNWRRNVLPKVQACSVVTLTPDRPTTLLLISLLRTLLPLFLLSQSLLGWTGRAEHLEVECFPAAHHSRHDGILSVLPGKPGCGETGRDDVSRGEEGGRAGLSSSGLLSPRRLWPAWLPSASYSVAKQLILKCFLLPQKVKNKQTNNKKQKQAKQEYGILEEK